MKTLLLLLLGLPGSLAEPGSPSVLNLDSAPLAAPAAASSPVAAPAPSPSRSRGRDDEAPSRDVLEGGRTGSKGLVVFLHGGSWSPRKREELARRALNDVSSEARRVGVRVLVPLLPDEAPAWAPSGAGGPWTTVPWASPAGEARVLSLVEHEVATRRADAGRVTLAGHGAGATAALLLAARHPERFAAIALWSGSPSPLWDEQRNVVGLLEDPVPRLAGVPVYLFTADDDRVLDRAALALFTDAMVARREAGERYVLSWETGSGGHGFGEHGPARGLRFLKKHRKAARP